jgi:subtilisin-like proprotein convertase family protein
VSWVEWRNPRSETDDLRMLTLEDEDLGCITAELARMPNGAWRLEVVLYSDDVKFHLNQMKLVGERVSKVMVEETNRLASETPAVQVARKLGFDPAAARHTLSEGDMLKEELDHADPE